MLVTAACVTRGSRAWAVTGGAVREVLVRGLLLFCCMENRFTTISALPENYISRRQNPISSVRLPNVVPKFVSALMRKGVEEDRPCVAPPPPPFR